MSRLVIVQPYVPSYRVPFFDRLVGNLATDGIECKVVHGAPERRQVSRGDATTAPWAVASGTRGISVRGHWLRTYTAAAEVRSADAVIVEHASGALESTWTLLRHRQRVGVWGHIAAYVVPASPVDVAIKRWQVRRADHVFAYTERGARAAVALGAEPHRVTTTMNTVDTSGLIQAKASVTTEDVQTFRSRLTLGEGPVLAYIGALDESKRIDFLAEALDLLWVVRPDVRLVIGGAGNDAKLLKPAMERGQVVMVGVVDTAQKALIGATAQLLLMPGRVGLVAVESLALGLPLVTTDWPFHAPEMDYLRPDTDAVVVPNDVVLYATTVRDLIEDDTRRKSLASAASARAGFPSLDDMVARYAKGVRELLA